MLFDGRDLSGWVRRGSDQPARWKVEDRQMVAGGGDIQTKETFADFQLHVEFNVPLMREARGQGRGNSGVYLQGLYEIQVLDSYGLVPQAGDCGAIYGQAPPMVNACRPPGEWQSYDILFHAPRFDAQGNRIRKPRVSVLQNGLWIQDNVEIERRTTASLDADARQAGPILLQDHGNPVRYRNLWLRPLPANLPGLRQSGAEEPGFTPILDGKTLAGWHVSDKTGHGGGGRRASAPARRRSRCRSHRSSGVISGRAAAGTSCALASSAILRRSPPGSTARRSWSGPTGGSATPTAAASPSRSTAAATSRASS